MPSTRANIVAVLPLTTMSGVDASLTVHHRFRAKDPSGNIVGSDVNVAQGPVPSPSVTGVIPYVVAMDAGGYSVESVVVDSSGNVFGVVATTPIPAYVPPTQTINVPAGATQMTVSFTNAAGQPAS